MLLPVRNGGDDLPGWFESVAAVADFVVALDDGSTDATADVLAAHPLTRVLLRNPVRETYAGWDDRANRQALLDACEELEPEWVLQLDADERIPAADARALRWAVSCGLLDDDAGYLLRVLRIVDGDDGYDEDFLWVGRLFRWRPGLVLPSESLHLVPLPTSVPADRWVRTTLRILHLGSSTAGRRALRVAKYREADPDNRWQEDYSALLAAAREVRRLPARPPGLPVMSNTPWPEESSPPSDVPLMSVVVIARNDEDVIARSVGAAVAQQSPWPFEVIVVTSGTDGTADIVRDRFPDVRLVVLDRPALPGAARNAGLACARGRYVTFPGSHVELRPGSLEARTRRHLEGWAMVAGNVHNGTLTAAGWATYFVDHAGSLPQRPSGPIPVAPGACSYLRPALEAVGRFPEDMRTAEDTVVNTELFRIGYGAFREQGASYIHHSRCRTSATMLRHHHQRGQGLGQMILRGTPPDRPVLTLARILSLGLGYAPRRFRRTHHYCWLHGGTLRWRWVFSTPLAAAAIVAAWTGTWRELLRPGPGALSRLTGGAPLPHYLRRGLRRVRTAVRRRLRSRADRRGDPTSTAACCGGAARLSATRRDLFAQTLRRR